MTILYFILGVIAYLAIGAFVSGLLTLNDDDEQYALECMFFWPIFVGIIIPMYFVFKGCWFIRDAGATFAEKCYEWITYLISMHKRSNNNEEQE